MFNKRSVTFWSMLAVLLSCTGPVENAGQPQVCKVPAASQQLEQAICMADSVEFRRVVSEALTYSDTSDQKRIVDILERIWRADRSLGTNLPWSKLASTDFRALVVEQLAGPVRDGSSSVELSQLREFATAYSREHVPQGYSLGLDLLGATGAPGQHELIRSVALGEDEGMRAVAIMTLGTMCDAETERLLKEFTSSPALTARDRKLASLATRQRAGVRVQAWCERERKNRALD